MVVLIYIFFGCSAGLIFALYLLKKQIFVQWFIIWLGITFITFLFKSVPVLFLCLILFALIIEKKQSIRVIYFVLLLPVLPCAISYRIPFPGINFLVVITYTRIIILAFLAPALINSIKEHVTFKKNYSKTIVHISKTDAIINQIDRIILLYILYLITLALTRSESITDTLRFCLWLIVESIIPYFAISKGIKSANDFRDFFIAVFFTAILLVTLGLLSQLSKWNFYQEFPPHMYANFNILQKSYHVRGSFLRIGLMLGPIHLGYWLVLGLGSMWYLHEYWELSRFKQYLIYSLLSIVVFITMSRGAWLTFVFFVFIFLYQLWFKKYKIVVYSFVMIGIIVVISFASLPSLSSVDEFGTFDYRVDIITGSLNVASNNILFGTKRDIFLAEMEYLRQGQGIIDIVNTYIQVLLNHGLVGLLLFCGIYILSIKGLLQKMKLKNNSTPRIENKLGIILLSFILAYLLMIGTISATGLIPLFGWIILALCSAFIKNSNYEVVQ